MTYVESEVLELKSVFTEDLPREIVAFANTKGGKLIIGIDDDGNCVGVDDSKILCEKLSSIIGDVIAPDLRSLVSIEVEQIGQKDIVIVNVLKGVYMPYYLKNKGLKPNGVFTRLGNTTVPASEITIRNMLIESDGNRYEIRRSFKQDLQFDFTRQYFEQHGLSFTDANLRTLGILDTNGLYTHLGLLLSDDCSHSIKVAVFEDETTYHFIDRKEFSGSLFKQLVETYDYLLLNNKRKSDYKGLSRVDSLEYEDIVLREVLINAIIHREYAFSGSIIINIYSDRMEFVSVGGLVPGIHLEDIFIGISQCRNEKLANVFYRLELIEAYGTGIKKIVASYKEEYRKPVFKATSAGFLVIIPNRNNRSALMRIEEKNDIYEVDEKAEVILELLSKHRSLSRKEIQETCQMKQTSCIELLRRLETEKRITQIGKGKATRYRIY
jgi:ATP-dependent DNA helicase RecG